MALYENGNSDIVMPVQPMGNYGNNGTNFGWGGDGSFWIIILFLFAMFGGWGNGFGGFGGFEDINFEDIFDIFGNAFGGGSRRSSRGSQAQRGADKQVNLTISFEEAVYGCEKEFKVNIQ